MNVFDHASQIYAKAAEIGMWHAIQKEGFHSGIDRRAALDTACSYGNGVARDYLEWADNIKKERPELFEPLTVLSPIDIDEYHERQNEKWRDEMRHLSDIQEQLNSNGHGQTLSDLGIKPCI